MRALIDFHVLVQTLRLFFQGPLALLLTVALSYFPKQGGHGAATCAKLSTNGIRGHCTLVQMG